MRARIAALTLVMPDVARVLEEVGSYVPLFA